MSLRIPWEELADEEPGPLHLSAGVLLLLAGAGLTVAVLIADLVLAGRGYAVIQDGPPLYSTVYLTRIVALGLGAVLIAVGLTRRDTWARADHRSSRWLLTLGWIVTALATAVAVVLLLSPEMFTRLALEDGPAETASAVLLLASAVALAVRAVGTVRGRKAPGRRGHARAGLVLLVLAGLYALLGMEEISWGQRVFGFDTPEVLGANAQGETNLHNFATNALEVVFYASTTVFFVVGPWIRGGSQQGGRLDAARAYLPPKVLAIAFAPAAALNYDLFNVAVVQWGWWLALGVLLSGLAYGAWPADQRALASAAAVVCLALQVVLLARGELSGRLWDATEYREFFTTAALAGYATWLVGRRP